MTSPESPQKADSPLLRTLKRLGIKATLAMMLVNPPEELVVEPPSGMAAEVSENCILELEPAMPVVFEKIDWDLVDFGDYEDNIRERYEELALEMANCFGVPPELIVGVISIESKGLSGTEGFSIGPAGATGAMGVMPKEAGFPNRPTQSELLNDGVNLFTGTNILRQIYLNEDPKTGGQGNWFRTLGLYNAGFVNHLNLPGYGYDYAARLLINTGRLDLIPTDYLNNGAQDWLRERYIQRYLEIYNHYPTHLLDGSEGNLPI